MQEHRTITIGVVTASGGRAEQVRNGMAHYARHETGLEFDLFDPDYAYTPDILTNCDAFIAMEPATYLLPLLDKVPIVAVDYTFADRPLCRVGVDDIAVGRLAGEFLLSRRVKSLGYFGMAYGADENRFKGLDQVGRGAEKPAIRYEPPGGWGDDPDFVETRNIDRISAYLGRLTLPAGVLCLNDETARRLDHACNLLGIEVPEQIAILGVDNGPICEFASPRLSSIDVDPPRLGREAAGMACRLARGQTCDPREVYVPPRLVVQRDSTGACHHDDPIVSAARRFLLAHLEDDISVDDVAEACRVGRSTLDRVFRSAEGRGPAAVLREMRLERAKQLLITTDLPLADVAARCGFNYLSHFSRAFKEQTGQSPSGWRREHSSP